MRCKILIVDDFRVSNEIVSNALKELGYTTISCQDGKSALSLFNKNSFDVVITDFYMPKIDGIRLAKEVRKINNYKNTPILFLSSVKDPEIKKRALNMSNTYWVSKPFKKEQIKIALDNLFLSNGA